jgi:Predicted membrane protein
MLLAVLNVFYYLDRRRDVVVITATLTVLNFALSMLSIHLGPAFFGYGFGVALFIT